MYTRNIRVCFYKISLRKRNEEEKLGGRGIEATKLYRRGQYKEDLKITVGRVPMRVQKCMAVDKRADELPRVSPVSSLPSLYL